MDTKTSYPKEKINILLLENISAQAVANFKKAGYTQIEKHAKALSENELILVKQGKQIYQQYNCMSCHQIYRLGGYLGSELTTAWSDKHRGEEFIKAFLKSGGRRMPDFKFEPHQIDALTSYLKYVDSTATPIK